MVEGRCEVVLDRSSPRTTNGVTSKHRRSGLHCSSSFSSPLFSSLLSQSLSSAYLLLVSRRIAQHAHHRAAGDRMGRSSLSQPAHPAPHRAPHLVYPSSHDRLQSDGHPLLHRRRCFPSDDPSTSRPTSNSLRRKCCSAIVPRRRRATTPHTRML